MVASRHARLRKISVVTTSRADYGILRPVMMRIDEDPELELEIIASGTHLSQAFGSTIKDIEDDGFPVAHRVEMLLSSGTPEAISISMGIATMGFARVYAHSRPEILVVLGDRFEMHSAALAALPATIPVAHIHGGEVTAGAIDESLRHSITKLSHLHFVSTDKHAQRVIQLGEEPWRVTVSGSPSIDNTRHHDDLPTDELEAIAGMPLPESGFLVVTFHPATVEWEEAGRQADELFAALDQFELPVLISLPNADPGGVDIRQKTLAAAGAREHWNAVENLGTRAYFTALRKALAMVGNSSSGLIEAPSFALPAVNIGPRQQGRVRGGNVIDVPCQADAIAKGIKKAISHDFRSTLEGGRNPYGDGKAAQRIVGRLRSEQLTVRLVKKTFFDQAEASGQQAGDGID
jgi:UDP-hydrolysing UDP-N-acetyl-D-glucosamine 2-epimerase